MDTIKLTFCNLQETQVPWHIEEIEHMTFQFKMIECLRSMEMAAFKTQEWNLPELWLEMYF